MTPPLLPLFLAALFLLSRAAFASTLAISASAVCGVSSANGTLVCATAGPSAVVASPFLRFAEVSGGRGFLCALRAGGAAFFCWSPDALQVPKRVYNGSDALVGLAVGADHVAAYDTSASQVRWWRADGRFPTSVSGQFRSLASGDNFSCAIEASTSAVRCWGPRGSAVQAAFGNASLSSIAVGGIHACGVNSSGAVLCSAPGASPPQGGLFGLAVGDSHACALRRPNSTAVCWSLSNGAEFYPPANGTGFELLVAGGNLTCGLVTANLTVLCWSWGSSLPIRVPLPQILPGTCVSEQSSCECTVYPSSEQLCSGSGGGVICSKHCDEMPPPVSNSPPPSPTREPSRGVSKRWIAFVVVGAVGSFAGVCSLVYCLLFGLCHHKKVHNSVQPSIAGDGGGGGNGSTANAGATAVEGGVQSPYGSPNGSRSRSRSLFRRQRSRVMTRQRSGPSSFKDRAEEFTFAELAAATKDFALDTKIGAGSFGTVYRGKLPDGREVAIKRSESGPRTKKFQEKESAFRSELSFLSRLHHKHLVRLVGYCEEAEERLLVYEYMKNGALYDHLHPKSPASPPSPVIASWKMRIKILLDASRGIEYLHSYAVPPIIHRDIKSSNILLDASWMARVSDFGLSLMGPETEGAHAHLSMKAAGTVGYMDPEYYGLQHLTVKSDVYGFGVVMLEVLTGKRAIFKEEAAEEGAGGNPVSVVDYAVPSIAAGELGKVLDARAPEPAGPHEAEAVELVAYTAVHCVRLEGKDRPFMADIVANLETALALCEGSRGNGGGSMSSGGSISFASCD